MVTSSDVILIGILEETRTTNQTSPKFTIITEIPVRDLKTATYLEQEITRTKGFENLNFSIPMDNTKQIYIQQQRHVKWNNRVFTIKRVTRDKSSTRMVSVECDALWYDLGTYPPLTEDTTYSGTESNIMNDILVNTAWIDGYRGDRVTTFTVESGATPLYMLRYLAKTWNGELVFNTEHRTVTIQVPRGEDTGLVIDYDRNLKGITRIDDTTNFFNRIYMYGADGLTISSINGGLPYLEDYTWMDQQGLPRRVIAYTLSDERFVLLDSMKEHMETLLNVYSKPVISYELSQYILDKALNIGDTLYINDPLFGLSQHRVVEVEIDIINPRNSTYVLDNAIDDLSSNGISGDSGVAGDNEGGIIDDTGWKTNFSYYTGFAPYATGEINNTPYFRKIGKVVYLSGAFTNASQIASGGTANMATLPQGYRPDHQVKFLQQGSGNNRYLLTIGVNGVMSLGRYGNPAVAVPVSAWLNINCNFIANWADQ